MTGRGFGPEEADGTKPDFDFTAPEVIKALSPARGDKGIEYIGSATSHFQAEPILCGPDGEPLSPLSDWELELQKNLEGKPSGIVVPQDATELPRFLEHKEEYVARSAELGENMFRFSLDFARLCPEVGEFNEELMADYVRALALVKARGQEPMLTIHHWPMPKYLLDADRDGNIRAGGWEHPEVARHFRSYVEGVIRFLSNDDRIRNVLDGMHLSRDAQDRFLADGLAQYFITLNEPMSTLFQGYLAGTFPPFKRGNFIAAKHVLDRLVEAHDIAYGELKGGLKARRQEPRVGVSYNWSALEGIFGKAVRMFDKQVTGAFERDGAHSDFLGLQYYFRMTFPLAARERAAREYSDHPGFGDIYPAGMLEVIKEMHSAYPQKQIFVTEFGFPDRDDMRRPYWMLETVRYIIEAKKQGLPIKGMLLWSLVNNFEWERGMSQKFGAFDESGLNQPLIPSEEGSMRSWEVWQAATRAITSPSAESLGALQERYQTAYAQYRRAGGTY